MASKLEAIYGPLVTLRCCRDWPCHLLIATQYPNNKCGLCGQIPEIIDDEAE